MSRVKFKINDHRNGVLLTFVGALALGTVSCGERMASALNAVVVTNALTPEQEFSAILKTAEAGDAKAQNDIGMRYADGNRTSDDVVKAFEWFQKAAVQGHARGQSNLAWAYWRGRGVSQDRDKAIEWWQKSLVQGDAFAQAAIGSLYRRGEGGLPKDEAKGIELIQMGVAQGDAFAQMELGMMYMLGEGVPKDGSKTMEFLLKAAEQGNSFAQSKVAFLFRHGGEVPKDQAKSAEWELKAAAQGDDDSQDYMGDNYLRGFGVARDLVLAYAWTNLAVGRSSDEERRITRQRHLLGLERNLTPGELAEAQRLSSGWKKGKTLAREDSPARSIASTPSASGSLNKQRTGTLLVVSVMGHAVTNQHVADGCTELRVQGRDGVAKLITADMVNDLALLQVPGTVSGIAAINSDPAKLRQGDDIVVFGFPLNAVLSSGGNLTPGIVSAVTGLGNNSNQIQITAPIQPGSSGSPVLNRKGEVVGVVSMKLSDSKMAKATGSVGQNVNFAVSGQTLKSFLDAHKVEYSTGGLVSFNKSAADLADEAKKWTTVVECWK